MKKETRMYLARMQKLAHTSAIEYEEIRIAPFEVDKREERIRKERYIKWSYTLWGAIRVLGEEGVLSEEEQQDYEEIVYRLDEIAYEDIPENDEIAYDEEF